MNTNAVRAVSPLISSLNDEAEDPSRVAEILHDAYTLIGEWQDALDMEAAGFTDEVNPKVLQAARQISGLRRAVNIRSAMLDESGFMALCAITF